MVDQLYVLNQALGHLGEPTTDTVEPAAMGVAAKKCFAHLGQALDATLSRHGWLCALEYVTLEPTPAIAANFKYSHHFLFPGDALRPWLVEGCVTWEAGTWTDGAGATRQIIRTNGAGPVNASYVRRVPFEGLFPALADAVALECAARACMNITGAIEKARELKRMADNAVMLAMGQDGMGEGGQDAEISDPLGALRRSAW